MMNLSDEDFSSAPHSGDFIVADSLQTYQTGFHPKYDWRPDSQQESPDEDIIEQQQEPSDCEFNKEIAKAYTQGYLNGQQAAMVSRDQDDDAKDVLAEALDRLKVVDEAKLIKPLWDVILALFEQAVGQAVTDRELMKGRCDAAVALLQDGIGDSCLHVAASDADILQNYDCNIPIKVDAALLPGSVRLTHAAGQIISGTLAITQAIESRIASAERGPC